jgi:hypothetical protein
MAISVTWSPPTDSHGLSIDRYVVQVYDVGGPEPRYQSTLVASCPPCGSVVFPPAPPDHSYAFAVWPHVASGYGRPAGSETYRTPSLPGTPVAIAARPGPGPGTVTATWMPPASDGGAPLDGYVVQIYDVTATPVYLASQRTGCGSCAATTFAGLAPDHRYQVAVYAHSAAGLGNPGASGTTGTAGSASSTSASR